MTNRNDFIQPDRIRSGRRFAVDIDLPRDKTVCFTVSEDERQAIDALAGCLSRTRSSILTKMSIAFVTDCFETDSPDRLLALFSEYRATVKQKQNVPDRK